jgi:dTDP-6-deoxy-L-talose 4-dehydrogenase (NAD+)
MKIVLLTGSTGFVGRKILEELQDRGCKIRIALRSDSQLQIKDKRGIESVVTAPDLFSQTSSWWEGVCDGVDTVIHSAWYAEPGKYLYSDKNIDCLIGTMNLAKGASNSRIRKFIGIGTCFEYDLSNSTQSIETPLNPVSPYAAAKASVFLFLTEYFKQLNISFTWCRLFYLFGDQEDSRRFIAYLNYKLSAGEVVELTSGNQIRDFMDVAIAARQIVELSRDDYSGAANICSGEPISIKELAIRIAKIHGKEELLKFGARPDNLFEPRSVVGIPHFTKSFF